MISHKPKSGPPGLSELIVAVLITKKSRHVTLIGRAKRRKPKTAIIEEWVLFS